MGHAWAALEGAAAAAEQYERALRIEPRNQEALDHLALARFGQRRYEDALALYRTLLEINPDHALTHSNVGAALLRLGRPREALQSIERALALDPDLEIARIGLAEVRKLLDQPANTASAHKMRVSSTTSSRTMSYTTTTCCPDSNTATTNAVNAICATKPVLSASIWSHRQPDYCF